MSFIILRLGDTRFFYSRAPKKEKRAPRKWEKMPDVCFHMIYPSLTAISLKSSHRLGR